LRHLADLTTTPIGIKTEALLACLRCGDRSAAAELAAFLTDSDLLERELRRQPIFPRASVRSTKRWVRRVLVSEHATEALPVLTEAVALSSGIERWRLNRLTRQLHAS
jgi:hypothetical protein